MPSSDRLYDILKMQHDAQRVVQIDPITLLGDNLPTNLEGEVRVQYIKDMILACTDELHEALAETGWKPWATSRHIHRAAALGELRDALQFLINAMFAVSQLQPEQLAQELHKMMEEKIALNLKRAADGYDGVKDKCPACRRDLNEHPPKKIKNERISLISHKETADVHCICGQWLRNELI